MSKRNEKWLDEQLKKTVDCGKVEFDGEQWKRKYSAEYQKLISRATRRPKALRFFVRIAAVIAIAMIVILFASRRSERVSPVAAVANTAQSPAEMMSILSLSTAYRHGGLPEVDEQCSRAFKMLGRKNSTVSMAELLNDKNG